MMHNDGTLDHDIIDDVAEELVQEISGAILEVNSIASSTFNDEPPLSPPSQPLAQEGPAWQYTHSLHIPVQQSCLYQDQQSCLYQDQQLCL